MNTTNNCHSAIYAGQIRHRRHRDGQHAFTYPIAMLYVDLDELPALFKDICVGGLCFVAEALIDALNRDSLTLTAASDPARSSCQLAVHILVCTPPCTGLVSRTGLSCQYTRKNTAPTCKSHHL